jgi:hypothetical protein
MIMLDDGRTRKPTVKNIAYGLQWLMEWANNDCDVWFTYSGHGGQMKDTESEEPDKKDEVIYPVDFESQGALTDDYLSSVFHAFSRRVRVFCISDACHSGTALDLPYQMKAVRGFLDRVNNNRETAADIFYFSGCTDAQESSDFSTGGAMTTAFFTVLVECEDEFISPRQLIMGINDWMRSMNLTKQTPQLSIGKEKQEICTPLLPTTPAKSFPKRFVNQLKKWIERKRCSFL